MVQNAPVMTNPKGIPNNVTNPSPNDWVTIQQDATNQMGKARLSAVGLADGNGGVGSATAVAGAATLNTGGGTITSEALTSATTYTLTLTNNLIRSATASVVLVNVLESTHAAAPAITNIVVSTGQVVITVTMASFTGTLQFIFAVMN